MTIYKNKDVVADIRVTDVNIGHIGAKWYTEDENTASIDMFIRYNNNPFDLTTTTMVPRLDLFLQDGSIFPNEPVTITNATNGELEYKIREDVIKHVGRVNAKLLLESGTESVHVANFSFDIADSGIESAVAKEINVPLLDDIINQIILANPERFRGQKMTFGDLTEEEKASLVGPQGPKGEKGDGLQIDGVVATVNELPTGTTKLTYLVGTVLYFRNEGQSNWVKGSDIKGVDGQAGSIVTIGSDGYWYIDGVKSTTKADLSNELIKISQLVNLLGNIGGFHKDTDGNGVADGWTKNGSGAGAGYSWSNGKQLNNTTYNIDANYLSHSELTLKPNSYYIVLVDYPTSPYNADVRSSEYFQVRTGTPITYTSNYLEYKKDVKVGYKAFATSTNDIAGKFVLYKTYVGTVEYDNVRIYEISKAEYDAITTMTPIQIVQKYPYTEPISISQINGLQSQLDGKAPSIHNHDSTYIKIGATYTKSESDNKYAEKTLVTSHVNDGTIHITSADRALWDSKLSQTTADSRYVLKTDAFTKAQADLLYKDINYVVEQSQVDLTNYYNKTEVDNKLLDKVSSNTLNSLLLTKADSTHNHDTIYAPINHTHAISNITGLQSALDGKALISHNHDTVYRKISDSYSKTEIDSKISTANATDMSLYLKIADADNKYATKVHTHAISDISNLQNLLDTKASLSHGHAILDITGLQSALDGKASSTHTHTIANITNLQTTLDGKASTTHTHTTANITGLDTALAGKVATTTFNAHTGDTAVHVSTSDRTNWNSKLDKTTADNTYEIKGTAYTKSESDSKYMLKGEVSSGTGTIVQATFMVDVVKDFGLVGDGTTDNYLAIKKWRDHANANSGTIYWVNPKYNGQPAIYRSTRYKQIKNIDGSVVDGTDDDIIWNCKDITIYGNGAKFVSMPVNGFTKVPTYENSSAWYTKEEHLTLFNFNMCENLNINGLHVDGEVEKIKWASGVTLADGTNAKFNGKQVGEGRGHGIVIGGGRHISLNNVRSHRFSVDGLVIGFNYDWANYKMINTEYVTIKDCDFWYNGRLGASGLGLHGVSVINCTFNFSGTILFNSPAMGFDLEPHGSPIGADNKWLVGLAPAGAETSQWSADKWNGNFKMIGGELIGNRGGAMANTSTMLTRNVSFENVLIKASKNFPYPHWLITSALQHCEFINCDIDGTIANNQRSFVFPFSYGGSASQPTGVLLANYANVKTIFKGGQHKNYEFWTNDDDNGITVRNDIAYGEWGLHETFFENMACTNVMWRYNHSRKSTMKDCQLVYTNDQNINYMNLWNATIMDTTIINKRSSAIILGFGSGLNLSQIRNLQITAGKFTFRGDAPYKTRANTNENIDVYDRTTEMDYVLSRIGTGGTTTSTTTNATTTTTTTSRTTTSTTTVAGQTTTTTTTTTTVATSNSNQIGIMSNATPVTSGYGLKKQITPKLSVNWNSGHTGIDTSTAWTISTDKIVFNNKPNNGQTTTTQTANERYIYFMFENLKGNTTYTLSYQLSATPTSVDVYTWGAGITYNLSSSPQTKTVTFTTDSAGKYGYDWGNATMYGSPAPETIDSQAFVYKGNLPTNESIIFDKVMLSEGSVAKPYTATV